MNTDQPAEEKHEDQSEISKKIKLEIHENENNQKKLINDTEPIIEKSLDENNEDLDSDRHEIEDEYEDSIALNIDQELATPSFSLHRNSDLSRIADEFIPGDLITLVVNDTGDRKISRAIMYDARNQIRYQALSGGKDHSWTTRIQKTKIFGEWKFMVEGPLTNTDQYFHNEIRFSVVKFLPEQVEPIEIPIPSEIEELVHDTPIIEIPVIEVNGVGPTYSSRLNDTGIFYFHQLLSISPLRAAEITNCTPTKAEAWYIFIKDVVQDNNHELMRKYAPIIDKDLAEEGFIPLVDENDTPEKIKGIGPATAKKLSTAGYNSMISIANSSPQKLATSTKVNIKKATTWIYDAQMKLFGKSSIIPEQIVDAKIKTVQIKSDDSPTVIKGIGLATAKKLKNAGFNTVQSISQSLPEEIAVGINTTISKASGWVSDAQIKLLGKTSIDISKVKKAKLLSDKNPLQRIRGVGSTYNRRFKEIGIDSLDQFMELSVEKISAVGKVNQTKAKQWLDDAIRLATTK